MPLQNGHENYFRKCLQEFPNICKLKYGVVFDLASVEEKVKHLRRRTPLSYPDLEHFKSPEEWYFDRFYMFPPEEKIGPALEKEIFDFWNLPGSNEEETVRKLLYIFKSIELASIILILKVNTLKMTSCCSCGQTTWSHLLQICPRQDSPVPSRM